MGFLSDLVGGATLNGVKGVFEGIGGLAKDIRSAITGEISPEKKAEIESKLLELQALSRQGQLEVNKQEAAHPSIFVSGGRPAIIWVCAISIGMYFIPQYAMAAVLWTKACWIASKLLPYPIPEPEGLIMLVGALLGLGGLRTIEKIKGVARN